MYIKSVVIDGFKSYAQRTEINGFDPQFNAITGLNGSGKSNILDSICFLLGISNLQQVRATNLQELIYKNGQAGITKATVSITFDNRDKQQSPLGYEQCDEITVTRQIVFEGRNKYLINGTNANNMRVQDMFRSVQLNVNNPHFLIMQGRITKVLNMKPPEILSMIEEAAGTRLYESKKEVAQKTIEKKDAKMKEIDSILKEEITPTLNRLKEERASYLEYQNVIRDLEHLTKLYIAYQFVCAEEVRKQSGEELIEIQEKMKEMSQRSKEIDEKVAELNVLIDELQKKRDKEAGGVMEKLEGELAEKQKVEAKAQAALTNKKDTVKQEQKKLQQLKKQLKSDETTKGNKLKELEKLGDGHTALLDQHKKDEEAHVQAQKHFHAVSAGLSSNTDGEDASLNDQLMNSKKEVSNSETETKMAEMRLKHAKQEIKKKQADLKKTESSYEKDASGQKSLQDSIKKIQAEMAKLNYEDGKEEQLQQQRAKLAQETHQLQDRADSFTSRYSQLNFNFRDPEANFDRRKVKGLVAKLIKVNDTRNATALEVTAGGKLYNVVVDTEMTGKKLLQKGELQRRVTIIPLNKIAGRSIDDRTVKAAERLVGKNNVSTALSLIGYERELETAMQYVFGTAFVCPDMNTAKQVTYHRDVMKKSVTLSGESFDPAGTLTGGSRPQLDSVLTKIAELNNMENELYQKQSQIEQIDNELRMLKRTADRYRELKYQLEMKTHEYTLLEERLKQSTHHQQLEEFNALQKSIEDSEKILKDAEDNKQKAIKKISELENKIKNAKKIREQELKDAEKAMENLKKALEKSRKTMKDKQQEVDSIQLELEGLEKDLKNTEDEIKAVEEALGGLETQLGELDQELNKCKESVKEALDKVNQQKELLKECNKDINEKINQLKALSKEGKNIDIAVKEAEHKVTKCNSSAKDAAKQVEALLQKYSWIAEEKKYFGQPKTAYDFKENDPKEAGKRIEKLQATKDKLAKSINMRAMSMLSKTEEQYNDLIRKRQIVLNDKAKIAAVIAELDEKKNEALKKAHKQVNKDFGSIFSALLPGTQAKLVAPDGCNILQGLEVKVAFGDVWKESLTELSGGQRSLVALSLILSLLLFKPAPIYILDEVDAALDLSHTQNIGQMLRTHFTHSQFIVVSLKDGMFNNANVLFKTRFVDGVSAVQRFTQLQPTRGVLTSSDKDNAPKDKQKNKNKRQRQDGAAFPV